MKYVLILALQLLALNSFAAGGSDVGSDGTLSLAPKGASCTWEDWLTLPDNRIIRRSSGVEILNPQHIEKDTLVLNNVRSKLFKHVFANFELSVPFLNKSPGVKIELIDDRIFNKARLGNNSLGIVSSNGNILLQVNLGEVSISPTQKGIGRIEISCSVAD